MLKKSLLVAGMLTALVATSANAEIKTISVNGEKIPASLQQKFYDQLVKQGQQPGEQLEQYVRTKLIEQKVILQEAKKDKIESIPEVKEQLKQAHDATLSGIALQQWAKKHPVKDADVKKAYEARKKAYGDTEYNVHHILVKTEDQAKNLIARLNKGNSFHKLASEFSLDNATKANGGALGWVSPATLPQTLSSAFTALKPGDVAQAPIRTQYGFHVVQLEGKRKAQLFPSFEQQKAALEGALLNQKVQQYVVGKMKAAKIK